MDEFKICVCLHTKRGDQGGLLMCKLVDLKIHYTEVLPKASSAEILVSRVKICSIFMYNEFDHVYPGKQGPHSASLSGVPATRTVALYKASQSLWRLQISYFPLEYFPCGHGTQAKSSSFTP